MIVLSTAPDAETAARLARELVEARLAACVNLIPGLTSVYAWQGAVHTEPEVQLVIKTRKALWHKLEAFLRSRHPYEVPEVLGLDVAAGAANYLDWLNENTHVE